ncbi:MAG: Beta-barrel assembly-enhancing protease [Burkholderiaceae bacterium]|nr:Beta-barrel assembly-enhancing protease [Burkholderiaceae bacterium]
MDRPFVIPGHLDAGPGAPCEGALHGRRRVAAALLASWAWPGVAVATIPECKRSSFTKMVSAQQVEQAAGQQYQQMLQQASGKRALGPKDHPQVLRLRYIAQRIIPFADECNPAAKSWRWEVNLIGSQELNAFCMPGGKIAFYYGILSKLQLDDDEVAAIMGHEISHALLEHARERMGKTTATRLGIELGAALLGLGNAGRMAGDLGGQLLTLRFSRDDESEADRLGMIMAAKAGYDPRAGVTLWKKMMAASKGAPPQFLSTHPSSETRIHDIEALLPRVEPIYAAAPKPTQRFGPPASKAGSSTSG